MNDKTKKELEKQMYALLNHINNNKNLIEDKPITTSGVTEEDINLSDYISDDVVQTIIKDNELKKLYSKNDLYELIGLAIRNDRMNDKVDEYIVKHIIELLKSKPKKFFCLIPIYGIDIKDKLELGIVCFYPISKKEEVINSLCSIWSKQFIKHLPDNTESFALIEVNSALSNKAIEIAVKEVNRTLDILKFVFNYDTSKLLPIGIGINMKKLNSKTFISINDDNKGGSIQFPSKYCNNNLNVEKIKYFKKYINRLLDIQRVMFNSKNQKQVTCPLERDLFHANNLIAEGLYEETFEKQISKFITSIEALLENKGQGISDKICERTALLLGHSVKKRMEIYNKMRVLYNKRSILTHGDNTDLNYYDANYIFKIAKELCIYLFNNFDKFKDTNKHPKTKLIDYALELKFGSGGLEEEN